jgi:hypothetical protein
VLITIRILLKYIQGLSELADQNNMVKSSSFGNNRKNILKNPSSLDFKIRTLLIDQSRVHRYKITLKNYISNYRKKFDCCKDIIIEYYVIINYF